MNMKISNRFKGMLGGLCCLMVAAGTAGCNKFLDVMPDNVANMDHVFVDRTEAERFMATLYSYAPPVGPLKNFNFLGADDLWTFPAFVNYENYIENYAWQLARGEQNTNTPLINRWGGGGGAINMFMAIRDCNTFIEELDIEKGRLPELDIVTRNRWICEAKFLKAYYHFLLFRMYGPIPIVDQNIAIDQETSVVRVKRNTVDEVVEFITDLLDEAAINLPLEISDMATEAGRLTKGAAYTLKAKVLVYAASPLFNGNPDYIGYEDYDGTLLFPQEEDEQKWLDAVYACEEAFDNLPRAELYEFSGTGLSITDKTRHKMNYRGATTDAYNQEIIWGRYINTYQCLILQAYCAPLRIDEKKGNYFGSSYFSVSMQMAERFYTRNGVPLDEDKYWNQKWGYANRYTAAAADIEQSLDIIDGYTTARLNMDREPRFYGGLAFDGARVFMKYVPSGSDQNSFNIHARFGDPNGYITGFSNVTGYWVMKFVEYNYSHSDTQLGYENFPWPELRLADLKLLYAEALNEVGRREDAIKQLDDIRARVGLKGVVESWQKYSSFPDRPKQKETLREIIHQEREIELAFEHNRIWDMRRWRKAINTQNGYIRGWNVMGRTPEQYYQLVNLYQQNFVAPRDYLWPISDKELLNNPRLKQNPGW